MLDHLPGSKSLYTTWQQNREGVTKLVSGYKRLAAQYSPDDELPTISRLDAGIAALVIRTTIVPMLGSSLLVSKRRRSCGRDSDVS